MYVSKYIGHIFLKACQNLEVKKNFDFISGQTQVALMKITKCRLSFARIFP